MRKKVLALSLLMIVIIAFTGCSKKDIEKANQPAGQVDQSKETQIGNNSKQTPDSSFNAQSYLGKWISSDNTEYADEVYTEGGAVLEITEAQGDQVKGNYYCIQSPPANRVAGFDFEGNVQEGNLTLDFKDDFFNTGNATIKFLDNAMEVSINSFKLSHENSSGWGVHSATLKRAKLEEEESENKTLNQQIIGLWHVDPYLAAGWGERYRFFNNGNFKFEFSQYDEEKRVLDMSGKWEINNNKLLIKITNKTVVVGGELVEASPSAISKHSIINGKEEVKQINPPELIEYSIGQIEIDNDSNYKYKIKINGQYFWKFSDNPNTETY